MNAPKEITCLQMQMTGFDKCEIAKPANPDIVSAQIQMYDFNKSTRTSADVLAVLSPHLEAPS